MDRRRYAAQVLQVGEQRGRWRSRVRRREGPVIKSAVAARPELLLGGEDLAGSGEIVARVQETSPITAARPRPTIPLCFGPQLIRADKAIWEPSTMRTPGSNATLAREAMPLGCPIGW